MASYLKFYFNWLLVGAPTNRSLSRRFDDAIQLFD